MTNEEQHVVLGANGNTGRLVIKLLLEKNISVKGITKSGKGPAGIPIIKADATNFEELKKAVAGSSVIYHCLGIPYNQWFEKHPLIMKNLIEAASLNGKETKIVYADNLYAYGINGALLGPINENTPEIANDRKGILRKEMGSMLMEADKQGRIKATIARASDFFGPEASNSLLEEFLIPYLLKGKKAKFFADLNRKHSWVYLPDFAKTLVTLALNEKAFGNIWMVPHYEASSIKEFANLFYHESGKNGKNMVETRPQALLKVAGLFSSVIREYSKVNYQMHIDWVVDDSKIRKTFNIETTPISKAINETIEWYSK